MAERNLDGAVADSGDGTGSDHGWTCILAALYLAGTPHGLTINRRRWRSVLAALREDGAGISTAPQSLRRAGLFSEASAIEAARSLAWAEVQIEADRVLGWREDSYPNRWFRGLGDGAPPVLWKFGPDAQAGGGRPGKDLGIVGSRRVGPEVHRYCAEVAREAVELGMRVVSGGATGCDQAALGAASRAEGRTLLIAPYGIDLAEPEGPLGQMLVSVCAPAEPFSTGRAMERNSLIYAASETSVVGEVQFQSGGTWHGATSALRRRLCRLMVRPPQPEDSDSARRGARALRALGAEYLASAGELEKALDEGESDENLFDFRGLSAG